MTKKWLVIIFILMATIYISQVTFAENISRLDIQKFFIATPGNAAYLPAWQQRFLNRNITWSGTIFSIQYQKDFNRTEITMKILPGTLMYDTVVYVPGNVSDKFNVKDEVTFTGSITRGIDMLGVKEVQINVGRNLGDCFGDYVFSENGMVNVNFLKPNLEPEDTNK